jgi:hypothetical protein
VNASGPPFDDSRRLQAWERLEPQARRFRFTVAELPRLDDLIRFANGGGQEPDRVFDCDMLDH